MTNLTSQDVVDLIRMIDIALKHPTLGGFAIAERACELGIKLQQIASEPQPSPTKQS